MTTTPQDFAETSGPSSTQLRNLLELVPPYNDRAAIVGRTGSGKTTLAEFVLRHYAYVAVLDTKGLLQWRGYQRFESFAEVERARHHHLIYAPSWNEHPARDRESVDRFFEWLFARGNTVVYVDEVMSITRGNDMPEFYLAAITRGREFGIGVHSSTQRPKQIPQVVLSEAESFFVFSLQLPQDRERIQEVVGEPLPLVRGHEFAFRRVGTQAPFELHRLRLDEGGGRT